VTKEHGRVASGCRKRRGEGEVGYIQSEKEHSNESGFIHLLFTGGKGEGGVGIKLLRL